MAFGGLPKRAFCEGGVTMSATPPPSEGERRKLAAHALLEARHAVFVNRGRRALLLAMLADDLSQGSADDVRDAVTLPADIDPVCLGCVPSPLVRAGIIRRAGYRPSVRAAGHARPVTVWRLIDRAAACRWLTEHPDRPDPTPEGDAGPALFNGPNITLRKNADAARRRAMEKESSYGRI